MKINNDVWGPYYWFFLHTISLNYPNHPTENLKKKYYDLISNFYLFIPDLKIGSEFNDLITQYPVSPFLDSKKSFIHWVHSIHNKINLNLGKPKISLTNFYDEYFELTKPKQAKDYLYKKWTNKIIFLLFLIFLLGIIVYLYKL